MTWMEDAACRGYDSSLWFGEKGRNIPRETFAICGACPVQAECLRHAARLRLTSGMPVHGVWAGRVMDKLTVTQAERILGGAA